MAMYDNDQTYLKTLSNISYAIINKPQDLNLVETTKLLLPIPIQDDSERLINISAKLSTITELFQHAAHPEDHLTCICNKVISEGLIPKLMEYYYSKSDNKLLLYSTSRTILNAIFCYKFPTAAIQQILQMIFDVTLQIPSTTRITQTLDFLKQVLHNCREVCSKEGNIQAITDNNYIQFIAGCTTAFVMDNWQLMLKLVDMNLLLSDTSFHSSSNAKQDIELHTVSFLNLVMECVRRVSRKHDSSTQQMDIILENIRLSQIPEILKKDFIHHLILRRTLDIFIEIFSFYNLNLPNRLKTINLVLLELTVNCLKDIVDNRENLSSKYIIAMQNISLFSGFYHSARNEAGSKIGKSVMNDYACSSSLLRKLMLCLFASLRIVLSCEVNKSTGQTDEDLVFRSIESIIYYLHVFHDIVATGNAMSTSQDNCNDTTGLAKTLVNTFIDEDDSLVQIILWLLDVYSAVKIFSNSCSCRLAIALAPLETFMSQLQPDLVFILLIKYFYYDHTVLLDMLISNETNFLECFVKYLKFIIQDWDNFRKAHDSLSDTSLIANEHLADIEAINVSEHSNIEIRGDHYNETDLSQAMSVNEIHDVKHHYDISLLSSFENYSKDTENGDDVSSISSLEELYSQSISSISSSESFSSTRDCEYTLDKTMAVLIRLNLAIERLKEKDLFPYCPDALLKLLSQVEELYEAGY
ncbi:Protein Lines-like protein 1 [Trichoplax sp. H2]|nr:Protein Lines-like protein 1 [Trichoplax sp. H2]|eukprot:RDD37676.1 Protein Lines-like protein 1 [Trichoplax sp. H2]